jgi:hypothetical protein
MAQPKRRKRKATLDWGEQIARRLVAMRLANETPTQEEQRS